MTSPGAVGEATAIVFEELSVVLQKASQEHDILATELKTLAAQRLAAHCVDHRSPAEALYLTCLEHETRLGQLIFGSALFSYNAAAQELNANGEGHNLRVVICAPGHPDHTPLLHDLSAIILLTDFRFFSFLKPDRAGQALEPFAAYTASKLYEEIVFTGSIWNTIFPSHFAIVSRTVSYTVPVDVGGTLFSARKGKTDAPLRKEQAARDHLACIDSLTTDLLSLEELCSKMQSCSRPPRLLSEHKKGEYTVRQYSPQRSSLFDFGYPAGEMSRSDFVTTYNVGNEEFHREFFISPRTWEPHEDQLRLAAFDILHLLATRRAKLFRIGFASRVYNILLPPLVVTNINEPSDGYGMFLCLSLYRTSSGGFRRTLSVTTITCPLKHQLDDDEQNNLAARPASLEELHQLKDELLLSIASPAASAGMGRFTISGPGRVYYQHLPGECSLPDLVHRLSQDLLQRLLASSPKQNAAVDSLVNSMMLTSSLESKMVTMLLQVEWTPPEGFTQPWERWLATGEDEVFCSSLFRTLFYQDFLNPHLADASRHAVQFEEFNVGNTLGADMAGMTLCNPQESLKVVLYPKSYERYPNHSIVRWMTWQVYIDSALTSLRALLYKFHPFLEERGDLHSIIDTLDEMIQEFVDFYDLDIRDYFYRKEYEKLRSLMQVDADYDHLLAKFASSKEDESLREQRLINKLLVSFTIATVTITVVSTIAQMGKVTVSSYLVIALLTSTVLVWAGYVLFDPVRLRYERLTQTISSLRR